MFRNIPVRLLRAALYMLTQNAVSLTVNDRFVM